MGVLSSVRSVVAVLRANLATFIAGSLAYNAFMSIVPLLMLALITATLLGDHSIVRRALELTEAYLTPRISTMFEAAVQQKRGRIGISLTSFLLLVWSALRVFRGLSAAFGMFYDSATDQGLLSNVRDGLLVLVALATALVASVTVGAISALTDVVPLHGFLGPLLLVIPLLVAFLPIYYVFPDADVDVSDVLPGVVVAAVGWALLAVLFQAYVARAGEYALYGTLGAVLLVLTWLYAASLILLVGVAVNVVLDGRTREALDGSPRSLDYSPSD